MFQLIEFSVSNFRSFKDRATLSFVASKKISSRDQRIDVTNLVQIDAELSLLKSAAIYGANASGKSNLLTAIGFMRGMVEDSSKETSAREPIATEPFRLGPSRDSPSSFEAVFLLDKVTYRYGFAVDRAEVKTEWLFSANGGKETRLFTREDGQINVSRTAFKEGKGLEERTRPNALFLSVAAQFNGPKSLALQKWFVDSLKVVSGLDDEGYRDFTLEQCKEEPHRRLIAKFVRMMDLGIEDLSVATVPYAETLPRGLPEEFREFMLKHSEKEAMNVSTVHKTYDALGAPVGEERFDIQNHESEGTKKIFALAGPILDTLSAGRVLFVDELDARLHPVITKSLVQLFNSDVANPAGAQLVFTTHDTNLLHTDLLRRDQVWFCEKDKQGGTVLYSLLEYKPRNDSSLEKNYIQGRYGAIPFVGDLSELISTEDTPS